MTWRNGGGAGSRRLWLGHVWLQVSFRYDDCDIVIVGVVWLWWLWYWLFSFVCVCVYVICVFDGVRIFEGMADTCWRRSLNRWCEPCSINDVHHLIFALLWVHQRWRGATVEALGGDIRHVYLGECVSVCLCRWVLLLGYVIVRVKSFECACFGCMAVWL